MPPHSKLCCVLCILLTWIPHRFPDCRICSIFGELSISGQLCSTVSIRHICHQHICENALASYLTALRKEGFGKKQQLCGPRAREEAQRPASNPDTWFSPEALNTGIKNQDTATASKHPGSPTVQRRSLNLSVPKKVLLFRKNNTHM